MQRTRVLQHHYNALTQKWTKQQSEIQIEDKPFAEGAFRAAYSSVMPWEGNPTCHFVCKFAKDPTTPKSMYFNDVEAHEIATLYARKFNEHLPEQYPRIGYVPAFIVEFVDRPGRPVCGCEQLLDGKFKKYNNNVGAVCAFTPEEQAELLRTTTLTNWDPTSTAQAFSHFSYEHSQSQVLICDIQGVENRFTDPQIHTMSGKGFGLGNLGQTGIRAFLLRHTCGDICRAVGLHPIKAKDLNEKHVQANFSHVPVHHAPPGSMSATSQALHANKRSSNHNSSNSSGNSDVLIISDSSSTPTSSGPQQQLQQPAPHRGLSSSASTAFISHQVSQAVMNSSSNAATSSGRSHFQHPPHPQHSHQPHHGHSHPQQHHHSQPPPGSRSAHPHKTNGAASTLLAPTSSSAAPSPQPSPSASPKLKSVPVSSPSPPPPQPPPPPSKQPLSLDDSDEALMASIMGD